MLDHGVDVADAKTDLPVEPPRRLPIEADCLYAYSTVPGNIPVLHPNYPN